MTSHTVPKTLKNVSMQYQGLPISYILVLIVTAAVALFLIMAAVTSKNNIISLVISLVLLFIELCVFLKFMRSPSILKRTWLAYQFFMKNVQGKTVYPKFAMPAASLQPLIPIKEFYNNGLILFNQNHYGMLLKADPKRVSDDELDQHINQVRALTDSLHGELMIKSYVCSLQSSTRGIKNSLQGLLNEQGRTKEEKEHLYSLYQNSIENKAPIVEWQFYIFLGFGSYPTLQEAEIAAKQYYPGISERLNKTGMHIVPIINSNELGRTYRTLINQVKL